MWEGHVFGDTVGEVVFVLDCMWRQDGYAWPTAPCGFVIPDAYRIVSELYMPKQLEWRGSAAADRAPSRLRGQTGLVSLPDPTLPCLLGTTPWMIKLHVCACVIGSEDWLGIICIKRYQPLLFNYSKQSPYGLYYVDPTLWPLLCDRIRRLNLRLWHLLCIARSTL